MSAFFGGGALMQAGALQSGHVKYIVMAAASLGYVFGTWLVGRER